jgi:DNA-binding protein HU-beta
MTKSELVRAIAEKSGTTMADANRVLEALGSVAATTLSGGGEVTLPSIGKLAAVQKAERQGRNPRTGETKTIPAKKAVKFKAASTLKAAIQ